MITVKDLWRDRADELRKFIEWESISPFKSPVLLAHQKIVLELVENTLALFSRMREEPDGVRLFRVKMSEQLQELNYEINRRAHPVEQVHLQDKFFVLSTMLAEFDLWLDKQRMAGEFPLWFVAGENIEAGLLAYMNAEDGKWYIWTQEIGNDVPMYQLKQSLMADERFIIDPPVRVSKEGE